MVAAWGVRQGLISKVPRRPFRPAEAFQAFWKAKWEAFIPVFILIGIFGGFTTLVEVAALTVVYVLVVEVFVYRDVKLNDLPKVIVDCATLVGGVLIILGAAMGFTSYLVDAQVPLLALDWARENIQNKYVFLLALNVLLLVVGCLMDIFSAIIVVVPLIKPMGAPLWDRSCSYGGNIHRKSGTRVPYTTCRNEPFPVGVSFQPLHA